MAASSQGPLTIRQVETRLEAIGCKLGVHAVGREYHVYVMQGPALLSYQRGDFERALEAAVPEAEAACAKRSAARQ